MMLTPGDYRTLCAFNTSPGVSIDPWMDEWLNWSLDTLPNIVQNAFTPRGIVHVLSKANSSFSQAKL